MFSVNSGTLNDGFFSFRVLLKTRGIFIVKSINFETRHRVQTNVSMPFKITVKLNK